jgi:hypothetical protein
MPTGGDSFATQREQCDDGNTVLAHSPGVATGYNRIVYPNTKPRKAGIEVITMQGAEGIMNPSRWRARMRAVQKPGQVTCSGMVFSSSAV